jgi:protein involved in polysaccharide export with SLBB domain
MRLPGLTVILALALVPQLARAVDDDADPGTDPKANPARTTIEESIGTIEARDLLRVSISDLQGPNVITTRLIRVDEEGSTRLPYLKAKKLAGLKTAAAEKQISRAYKDENVVPNAIVNVTRVEAGSRVKHKGGPIAEGDLVAIMIDELTGAGVSTTFKVNVGEDGEVAMPLVGVLNVAGKTEAQAEQVVAAAYRDQNLLRTPIVAVRVLATAAETKVKPGPLTKGDLIEIAIWQLALPNAPAIYRARIDQDGLVGLPFAGALKLQGVSEGKAPEVIAKSYRDKHLIQTAMVSVRRLQSADQADVKLGPIAKGEILSVGIQELAGPGVESVLKVKVDERGSIQMPLVGSIKVEGFTETGAAQAIARLYRDQNLLQNAAVWVLKINGNAPLNDEIVPPAKSPPSKATRG